MPGKQLSIFEQQPEDQNNFFSRKRHWSAAKHRILLRYLQSHCYNTTSAATNLINLGI